MAYTYDDVVAKAKSDGVFDKLSEKDLEIARSNPEYGISMAGLLKDISTAANEEQRLLATEAANLMRKNYGVYSAPGGSYAASDNSEINKILDEIKNQPTFSYDPETDPVYDSYEKAYRREGDRASANALAQAAAASGGRVSSQAIIAAQQAGSYYAAQLADQIPTLRQNAYSEYLQDFINKQNTLAALREQDAISYERYLQENAQREAEILRQQEAKEAENLQKQRERENALALFEVLGYATPEIAAALGIPAGTKLGDTGGGGSGTGILGNSPVIPGGALAGIVNENSGSKDVAQGALEIANKIVGGITGIRGTPVVSSGNAGSNTGSNGGNDNKGQDKYSITNEHSVDGNWVKVGGKKVTFAELDKWIRTSKVVQKVNAATGAITYEPGPKWDQNRAKSVLDRKLLIT